MTDIEVEIDSSHLCKMIHSIKDGKQYSEIGVQQWYDAGDGTISYMVGCKEKKVNDYCAHSLYEYHWFETGTLQSVQKYKNGGCYGKKFVYYDSDTIERVTSYIIPMDMEFYSKTMKQGWYPNGTMEYRITTDSTKHCHGEGPIVEKKETWDEDGTFCGETYREYYM